MPNTVSDKSFRLARAWIGFTLLHEIGHYVYSQNHESDQATSQEEEFVCDRFALRKMIPTISCHREQAGDLYRKFVDFVSSLLVFFTHRWLADYAADSKDTHPATFKRTAQLIDIVNVDGAWTDLRNNLQNQWTAVQNVTALNTQRKITTSARLHEDISEKSLTRKVI